MPIRYKFQRVIPIYELFPPRMLKGGAKMMQPIVEPDRKKNKATFKSMLNNKNPKYIKRTIKMIVKWDKQTNIKKNYHIHGTKDHTLPIRKIKDIDVIIKKGSHMMALTRPVDINKAITELLKKNSTICKIPILVKTFTYGIFCKLRKTKWRPMRSSLQ